jgi:murein DD-endopeptidase MepM/ murein hydrolase activator NlpD
MKKIISPLLALAILVPFESVLCYAEDGSGLVDASVGVNSPSFLPMSKSRSAAILDDFKEREQELLFENIPFTSEQEASILDAEGRIRSIENILERLNNIKTQIKTNKRMVTLKKITLQNAIKEIEESIVKSEDRMKAINIAISQNNRLIVDIIARTDDINKKIEVNKETLLAYITYISKKSDLVYGESHEIDIMKSIILNDGNISDIYNDIYFKSLLEIAGFRLIEEHRKLITELYYNKERLKTEKREKVRLKNQITIEQKTLEEQKATKERLLEFTRGKERLFNQYLIDREEQENKTKQRLAEASDLYEKNLEGLAIKNRCNSGSVRDLIVKDEGDVFNPQDETNNICANLGQFIQAEKNLRLLPGDRLNAHLFDWPVATKRITTYFRDPEYFQALGSDHEAIDIPADQGSDIAAPRDGYVYFINAPKPGNYAYMAIKHQDGFVTVYGHLSEILVNNFEIVKKGQIIAKSG